MKQAHAGHPRRTLLRPVEEDEIVGVIQESCFDRDADLHPLDPLARDRVSDIALEQDKVV
jgi:hypothetical protein